MNNRLARLRELLRETELDSFVVAGAANRYYLSGFTGDNGFLLVDAAEQVLYTDFRYMEQARAEAPAFTLCQVGRRILPEFSACLAERGGDRIGFEPDHWSLADYQELIEVVSEKRLIAQKGMVEGLRAVKDPEEIERIGQAAAINDRAWARLMPLIKPGVAERDLAAELDYLLRREGADGNAFTTIVASGPRGALPHGTASARKIAPGDLVVFDFGAQYQGYASDMTRTVAVGNAGEKEREIYRIVAEAQALALAALRPGLTGIEVDAVARRHIKDAGYGQYFGHGLGHAVGIEIHEEPRLSPIGEQVLAAGMVVTVEPGIYLPGLGGVRIEDLVVLTATGCRNLTNSAKDMAIL
ncbi:MAG: M24 family metallopeptidase [Bacteroidota bacterium]